MNTSTTTLAFTNLVTHVTDKMLLSLLKIITWSGLNPAKLNADWQVLENGIKTWINSGHFQSLTLEVYGDNDPGLLVGRWDLSLSYGKEDSALWVDVGTIKYNIEKSGHYPSNCGYSLIIETKIGRPDVSGFSSTNFRSTDGFTRFDIGTMIGAGSLSSNASYWRKNI